MHLKLNRFILQYISNKIFDSGIKLELLLQHYEPGFFQTLRHLYETPTFKSKALYFVSNNSG